MRERGFGFEFNPEEMPPFIAAMLAGRAPEQNDPDAVHSVSGTATMPQAQAIALSYLASVGYAHLTGDESRITIPARMYSQAAMTMRHGTLDDLLEGIRVLYTGIAARHGGLDEPVNALAGGVEVLAAMVATLDDIDAQLVDAAERDAARLAAAAEGTE